MERATTLHSPLLVKSKRDEGTIEEVVRLGGVQQFPFLTDSENGQKLYESADIISYLEEYAKK